MFMKNLLILLSILIFTVSCSQKKAVEDSSKRKQSVKPVRKKPEIKETTWEQIDIPNGDLSSAQLTDFLAKLKDWRYEPNETNLDAEDLAERLSDRIVGSINAQKSYDLDKLLSLDAKLEKDQLKIYSLGHDSGGTRGFITYPIIVWKDTIGLQHSYNLSKNIRCEFEEIHQLTDNLYLLIGYESGDGAGYQSIVYVVEIKNNRLNNSYGAFVKRPYLNFTNGKYHYNDNTAILTYKLDRDFENLAEVLSYSSVYHEYSKDSFSAKKIKEMIEHEYYEKKAFHLKFNGKTFVALK